MTVIVQFYCHVISCPLERRGVSRGVAEATGAAAKSSTHGRGNAVTQSVSPRFLIENSFSSQTRSAVKLLELQS